MASSSPHPPVDRQLLDTVLARALSGKDAHVDTRTVFDGLEWQQAGVRIASAPHSVYQLLNHLVFWQHWVIRWFDGGNPTAALHASDGWPGPVAPESAQEWDEAVAGFRSGLDRLERRVRDADSLVAGDPRSRLEMLHAIATHNSYHAGQVVLLRQMMGAWPPPSGGLTW